MGRWCQPPRFIDGVVPGAEMVRTGGVPGAVPHSDSTMFYRMKFDGYVGGILREHGYSTSEQLKFWPASTTSEWITFGKNEKFQPFEAAAIAVAETAMSRLAYNQLDQDSADSLVANSVFLAEKMGACHKAMDMLKRHLRPEPALVEHILRLDRGYQRIERSEEDLQRFPTKIENADHDGNIYILETIRSGESRLYLTTKERFETALLEYRRLDQSRLSIEAMSAQIESRLKSMKKNM